MKRINFTFGLFSIVILMLFISSCGRCKKGSGDVVSEERQLAPFSGVEVDGSFNVYIKKDSVQKVVVTADDNILPNIETDVENGILEIELDNIDCVRKSKTMDVYISMPTLKKVKINGSALVKGEGLFAADNLEAKIAGSGNIQLAFKGGNVISKIEGSGHIDLSGEAWSTSHSISGSGRINAGNLTSQTASARISGSGSMSLQVIQKLDAEIIGSGQIGYSGTPQTNVSVSGSGRVFKQ